MTTAKIIGSAPVLLVADVVEAAHYYRDKAGFTFDRFWGDPPCFCILRRDNFHLMLREVDDTSMIVPRRKATGGLWDVYFWVDDVAALFSELEKRNVRIGSPLCDQPYGCREFGIRDLDDYEIAFGQDLET